MGQSSSQLQPGDLITTDISMFVNYNHHGIYVGDDMVIHLLPPAKQSNSSFTCPKCLKSSEQRDKVIKTLLVGTKAVAKASATMAGIATASALHFVGKWTVGRKS
ncbi:hypothetical protein Patl1_23249 [Pistacia atlantica]|uniref:Uncharacterized protein n=1 Tax=Pistacia atlantica TaxID=434234 RepID=A0ACC1A434_9ROSI|nr:hypothetical protein Patl1_23249 [Pistacia atlantica]